VFAAHLQSATSGYVLTKTCPELLLAALEETTRVADEGPAHVQCQARGIQTKDVQDYAR
jgi:hypothetical protein